MAETQAGSYLKGLRVLAVDDEVDVLDTIEDVLDRAQVDRAKDYESASRKLKEAKYDLAVLDIMGVNGLVLLAEAVNKGIPTVMLTAHALNPEALKTSIVKGALSYLPKTELPRLDEFLDETLTTYNKGRSTWKLLFERLGGFFQQAFGQEWSVVDAETLAQEYRKKLAENPAVPEVVRKNIREELMKDSK
jgi:DNA-binding NtrC family response regulator